MNVKERIISLKLIGKKQEHTKFLEEIGVTAIMKENICNLENGAKESGVDQPTMHPITSPITIQTQTSFALLRILFNLLFVFISNSPLYVC
jgi:hypothetical protein